MALSLPSYVTPFAVEIKDAYVRVQDISLPTKNELIFCAYIYADKDYPPVTKMQYKTEHNVDGGSVIAQAYEYLKTLPEFANATDC